MGQQAAVVTIDDTFAVLGGVFLACLPLVLLIRRGRTSAVGSVHFLMTARRLQVLGLDVMSGAPANKGGRSIS